MALRPTDIRNFFMSGRGEDVLNWILFEHHVFDPHLNSADKIALRDWGIQFLQMIGPKDNLSKVEWLKRAIHCEEDNDTDNN